MNMGDADRFAAVVKMLRKYVPENVPINMSPGENKIYILMCGKVQYDDISNKDWDYMFNLGLRFERPYFVFYIL
jgi:hypothetical protein